MNSLPHTRFRDPDLLKNLSAKYNIMTMPIMDDDEFVANVFPLLRTCENAIELETAVKDMCEGERLKSDSTWAELLRDAPKMTGKALWTIQKAGSRRSHSGFVLLARGVVYGFSKIARKTALTRESLTSLLGPDSSLAVGQEEELSSTQQDPWEQMVIPQLVEGNHVSLLSEEMAGELGNPGMTRHSKTWSRTPTTRASNASVPTRAPENLQLQTIHTPLPDTKQPPKLKRPRQEPDKGLGSLALPATSDRVLRSSKSGKSPSAIRLQDTKTTATELPPAKRRCSSEAQSVRRSSRLSHKPVRTQPG